MTIAGLRSSPWFIGIGLFILMFCIPFGSSLSQTIFQSKVEPDVQGRVFSFRSMISQSMMPLAFLLAGTLADHVFEPLLAANGALAQSVIGELIGTGPGRGIGFLFVVSGILLIVVGVLAYAHPRIRLLEQELPDVVSDSDEISDNVGEAAAVAT